MFKLIFIYVTSAHFFYYDGIMCFMFVIVGATKMEALLLYVARNSEHTNVWREDYQRHRDAEQRRCYSHVSQGGHNSSSYSTIMKKFEKDWPPAISLKYFRDRAARACRDNAERVTTHALEILKGPEENKVTHYKGMWYKVRHYRV